MWCRGAIHCALWDASTLQVGAIHCAPTPHLSSLRLFEMYWAQALPIHTNSNNLRKSPLDWFFRQWAVRTDISPWSEAPSDFFCWHIHQLLRDMTRQPHLASVALKRKPAAMGMKAPRAPSIVDGF